MTLVFLALFLGIAGVCSGAGILLGMDYHAASIAAVRRERLTGFGLILIGTLLVAAACAVLA